MMNTTKKKIAAISLLFLCACGEEATEIFVPVPPGLESAGSAVYLISTPGTEELVARAADDPSPLRPSVSLDSGGAASIEALLFDYSLEELGLESGPFSSLPLDEGISLSALDPVGLMASVSGSEVGAWRNQAPSARAAEIQVHGPCPDFEVTALETNGGPLRVLSLGDEAHLFGQGQRLILRFREGELIDTSTASALPFVPRYMLSTSPNQGWVSDALDTVGRFAREPISFEPRFTIPNYPDAVDQAGSPRIRVVGAIELLEGEEQVLIATLGGVVGTYDPRAGFERLAALPIGGAQERQSFIVTDEFGRRLIALNGYSRYEVYEAGRLTEMLFPDGRITATGAMAKTSSHGTILIARDTGVIVRQVRRDEWERLPGVQVDFQTLDVTEYRDGFMMTGDLGELAFYSERTGLCPAPPSSELRADSGVSTAVVQDTLIRVMRRDAVTSRYEVVLIRTSR